MECGIRGQFRQSSPSDNYAGLHSPSPKLLDMIQLRQVSNQVCNLVVLGVTSMYRSSTAD